MKRTILNPAGNWDKWPADRKEALEKEKNNRQVGSALVLENDKFKIWQIHLPSKQNFHFHKHNIPYFWTILTDGHCLQYYSDGSIIDVIYETGDTVYMGNLSESNSFAHNIENIGDTTLVFTTVELLK